ncbi:MAG TPA: MerR family transcriptional regulator [Bryobacteraceae bacterium]|nr:MerR family transcriptional regulator [Bryobacteraceae bacterium]
MSDRDIANGAATRSGVDAGVDAGAEAGMDAGLDAGPEPGLDAGSAAGPGPGVDAEATEIPDKLYFRIGEVARLAAIKPYVLRFWETEFPSLGPRKSGTGHRLYRRKDVEQVLEIKRLLYEKRFTIEGARKFLEDRVRSHAAAASAAAKGKGRGKAARAAAAAAPATADGSAGQSQKGLFDGPSPAVLDLVRKELKALAEMLK